MEHSKNFAELLSENIINSHRYENIFKSLTDNKLLVIFNTLKKKYTL